MQDGLGPAWVQAFPEEEAAVPAGTWEPGNLKAARRAMRIFLMATHALSMADLLTLAFGNASAALETWGVSLRGLVSASVLQLKKRA